jgi:hypothetical protein
MQETRIQDEAVFSFQFSVFSFQWRCVVLLKTENRKLKTAFSSAFIIL